jgi:diguanylate cyclase (GGDEF)-like protein
MLQGSYSYSLAFISVFIATLASYLTLDLTDRIAKLTTSPRRSIWLLGGAMSMGLGIWSMHFIGMLSFSLPIPLGYDLTITLYSLVIAVMVSYFALDLATRDKLSRFGLIGGGLLMGAGISAMHYTGMEAMQMAPGIQYNLSMFALSVLIAVVASIAALWIAFTLRTTHSHHMVLRRFGAALVMGFAIAGMHYTGMAAADFPEGSICRAASKLDSNVLTVTVVISTMSILVITLILSLLDARLEARTSGLSASLKEANEQLKQQATHDALTGLPNRSFLNEMLDEAIINAGLSGKKFAIFFMDLDGFKTINDSLGHKAGDEVLKELGGRLRKNVGSGNFVSRLGGDEFVIIMENLSQHADAQKTIKGIFDCFADDFHFSHIRMSISPSVGISFYPDHGTTADVLLAHADVAMYEAKGQGRNNYRIFEPQFKITTLRMLEIQRSLPGAVKGNQLFLQYQPKCDGNGEVTGGEALLRWQHPELGLISPAEFIPVAEKSGNIIAVGNWVVEEVARQIRQWESAGLADMKIAVNLSQLQLQSPSLVDDVVAITNKYRVSPSSMMFEITESVAMQNADTTLKAIAALKQAGFDFAIDDFGTGYSSLSYLHELTSVRELKLDRTYVKQLDASNAKILSIVSAIINLAHSLGMEVVAEGVETHDQLMLLKKMGCDRMQGYLFSKPLDSKAFENCLRIAENAAAADA